MWFRLRVGPRRPDADAGKRPDRQPCLLNLDEIEQGPDAWAALPDPLGPGETL
jgi:hypothetical protein